MLWVLVWSLEGWGLGILLDGRGPASRERLTL